MDNLDARRIVEMQGRRGVVRVIDLPSHLRNDGAVLLAGRQSDGDTVRIDYMATGEMSGVFGVFVEGVLTATATNLMSFLIPTYVLSEDTEVAMARLIVEAGIPFTLTSIRG